jgi:hypothetical protein
MSAPLLVRIRFAGDVAMNHAALVGEVQRLHQLRHYGGDLAEIEVCAAIQVFAQPRPLDELHDDERVGRVFTVLVHADDIRMQQPAGGDRLVLEARHRLLDQIRIDEVLAHRLDRNNAFDTGIEAFVDDAHRALA